MEVERLLRLHAAEAGQRRALGPPQGGVGAQAAAPHRQVALRLVLDALGFGRNLRPTKFCFGFLKLSTHWQVFTPEVPDVPKVSTWVKSQLGKQMALVDD